MKTLLLNNCITMPYIMGETFPLFSVGILQSCSHFGDLQYLPFLNLFLPFHCFMNLRLCVHHKKPYRATASLSGCSASSRNINNLEDLFQAHRPSEASKSTILKALVGDASADRRTPSPSRTYAKAFHISRILWFNCTSSLRYKSRKWLGFVCRFVNKLLGRPLLEPFASTPFFSFSVLGACAPLAGLDTLVQS